MSSTETCKVGTVSLTSDNQVFLLGIAHPTELANKIERLSIHQSPVENAYPLEWHQSLNLFWLFLDI